MRFRALILIISIIMGVDSVARAQPPSGTYTTSGPGLSYNAIITSPLFNRFMPANADGALGRTYFVSKANLFTGFSPRPLAQGTAPSNILPDDEFWAYATNPTNPKAGPYWNDSFAGTGSGVHPKNWADFR